MREQLSRNRWNFSQPSCVMADSVGDNCVFSTRLAQIQTGSPLAGFYHFGATTCGTFSALPYGYGLRTEAIHNKAPSNFWRSDLPSGDHISAFRGSMPLVAWFRGWRNGFAGHRTFDDNSLPSPVPQRGTF